MRISDESLRGRTVIASDGLAIGEIAGLLLDCEAWRVESLHVKLRRGIADRLGADRSIFRAGVLVVPIPMVQSVGDAVVLTVAVDGLRQFMASPDEISANAGH